MSGFRAGHCRLVLLVCLLIATTAVTTRSEHSPGIHLAVLAYDEPQIVDSQLQPLLSLLRSGLPELDMHLDILGMDELEVVLRSNRASIILTNPYHYLRLRATDGLSGAVGTVYRRSPAGPIGSLGGTIVVPAADGSLQSLEDLRGARVAIADRRTTGGYVLPLAELQRVGINRDELSWLDTDTQIDAVRAVLSGEADAAFLRSSLLESLVERGELDRKAVRVINRQELGDYPFAVSTRLYPEWPLVATGGSDPRILSQVLGVAFMYAGDTGIPVSGAIAGLNPPADYSALGNVLMELGLPPYDEVPELGLWDLWQSFRVGASIILAFVVVILALLMALWQRNRRLRQMSTDLQDTLSTQQRDRQRLERLNQQFEMFLEHTTDYVYFKDARRRFGFVSDSFARIAGSDDRHSLEGKTNRDVFEHELAEEYVRQEDELFVTGKPIVDQRQRLPRADGSMGWASTYKWPVKSDDGKRILGLFAISRDVTELHDQQQLLQQAAYYDSLTSLPNRSLFFDRLRQALALADRRDTELAVVYIDIDEFKSINDRYGHAAGDELLVNFAKLLLSQLRRADTVARLGGDEFVFLVTDFDHRDECSRLLDRLKVALAEPRTIAGVPLTITTSAGIAFYEPHSGIDSDQLMQRADRAMYQAKKSGRACYRIFDSEASAPGTGQS